MTLSLYGFHFGHSYFVFRGVKATCQLAFCERKVGTSLHYPATGNQFSQKKKTKMGHLNPDAQVFTPNVPRPALQHQMSPPALSPQQLRAKTLADSNLNPNAKGFTPSLNPNAKEFVPDHMEAMRSKNLQKEQARSLYMQYYAEDDEYFGAVV